MSRRLILGVFLMLLVVPLAACQVEEEVEGGDVTPTQEPTREGSEILVALDMEPTGNSCPGDGVNDCMVGVIDSCVEDTSLRETLCADAADDDGDGRVNDGCPAVGAPESHPTPNQCAGAADDDGDTVVNDGCPAAFLFDVVVQNLPIRGAGEGQATFDFRLQWGAPLNQSDAIDIVARSFGSPTVHYLAQATGSGAVLWDPSVLPQTAPPYIGSVLDMGTEEISPPWTQGTAWRGTAVIQNDAAPNTYELELVPGSVALGNIVPINECDVGNGPGCTLQGASVAVAPVTCGQGRAQTPTATVTPAGTAGVPGTPTVLDWEKAEQAAQADMAKPRFRGQLGDFLVVAPNSGANYPCPERYEPATDPERSELYFELPGAVIDSVGTGACQGTVISVTAGVPDEGGGTFVGRGYFVGLPLQQSFDAPAERLELMTVAGRPAIAMLPIPDCIACLTELVAIERFPTETASGITAWAHTYAGLDRAIALVEQIMAGKE